MDAQRLAGIASIHVDISTYTHNERGSCNERITEHTDLVAKTHRIAFYMGRPAGRARGGGPVSYTHLDVYKRQKLNRGEFHSGVYKRIGKGGREVWIQASYNPIFDLNGKPSKVVKYATDVTAERIKHADFEGQIAAIGKSQGVIEFTMDGNVITANDTFLNILGYSLTEATGQPHSAFVEPGLSLIHI